MSQSKQLPLMLFPRHLLPHWAIRLSFAVVQPMTISEWFPC